MEKQVKYNCIQDLKKDGSPIIIVAALYEAEAIYNACQDNNIKVIAFCDSEKRRSEQPYCGLEVIHSPTLPSRFPTLMKYSGHIRRPVAQKANKPLNARALNGGIRYFLTNFSS